MMMIVKMRIVLLLVIIHVLCDRLPPFLFVCVKWCNLWRETTRRERRVLELLSKLKKSAKITSRQKPNKKNSSRGGAVKN